jgi:phosphocarrier protein HPr
MVTGTIREEPARTGSPQRYSRRGVAHGSDRRAGPKESAVRSIEVEVRNEWGLHARPAAAFVRAAAGFVSIVRLENVTLAGSAVDAKSIVGVMGSGVERGHKVRVVADGADEDRAVETLRDLLVGLGEPVGE